MSGLKRAHSESLQLPQPSCRVFPSRNITTKWHRVPACDCAEHRLKNISFSQCSKLCDPVFGSHCEALRDRHRRIMPNTRK
ncbi:hypothetical protein RBSWK_01355 [Rhodopirellula baltica SWK14]|uniref:Uncharacterized protein n=1 Tax=Rhodopirellula baltica SWK14 TaxID=993516 RepID=L7CLJ7_RHOBT|nr:hypothetical protein RBSWK_01355 [Rhodopirellula baltica SWK14]